MGAARSAYQTKNSSAPGAACAVSTVSIVQLHYSLRCSVMSGVEAKSGLEIDGLVQWQMTPNGRLEKQTLVAMQCRYSFIANTHTPLKREPRSCRIKTICFAPLSSKLAASEFTS